MTTNSLDQRTFHAQYERLIRAIEEETGEPFISFREGLAYEHEGYKLPLWRRARGYLDVGGWSASYVGSGKIIKRVVRAIEIDEPGLRNNLVGWDARHGPDSAVHRVLRDASGSERRDLEGLLFRLYRDDQPGPCFDAIADIVGRRYELLAYLFFLRDRHRFAPIRTTTFDKVFVRLGIGLTTAHQCSWDNYQAYLGALGQVHDALLARELSASFLDAHSFCWMVGRFREAGDTDIPVVDAEVQEVEVVAGAKYSPGDSSSQGGIADFVALNQRRKYLGNLAEVAVVRSERKRLLRAGRHDLARDVALVSIDHTLGYDVRSFDIDGTPRAIEVKHCSRVTGDLRFFVTANEWAKSAEVKNYWFYLVLGAETARPIIKVFQAHKLSKTYLTPIVFRADVRVT